MDSNVYDWVNFLVFNLDGMLCFEVIGEMWLWVDEDCIIVVIGRELLFDVDGNVKVIY